MLWPFRRVGATELFKKAGIALELRGQNPAAAFIGCLSV